MSVRASRAALCEPEPRRQCSGFAEGGSRCWRLGCRSLCCVAAVDGEGDADDVSGSGAAQPQHGCGDVFGRTESGDRCRGGGFGRSSSPLVIMSATIGVSMLPGQTALMRLRRGAYSRSALVVSPITPCLEAWYAARPGSPTRPPREDQFTIGPLPWVSI
jgi:hypothetical protein